MKRVVEVGRVGGWRYLVTCMANGFEVLRQDTTVDQVEEALAIATTFETAVRKAIAEMDKENTRNRKQQTTHNKWVDSGVPEQRQH